jgi:uncharacterized protein YoxC
MRAALAALTAAGSMLLVAGCSDVRDSANEAASSAASIGAGIRSSAASIGAGLRSACQASDSSMTTLDDLAGKIADNAEQRKQLLPQVRSTVDDLAGQIQGRAELEPVVSAGRDLVTAVGDSSEATAELAARQAQVAVRSGQALCKLAK